MAIKNVALASKTQETIEQVNSAVEAVVNEVTQHFVEFAKGDSKISRFWMLKQISGYAEGILDKHSDPKDKDTEGLKTEIKNEILAGIIPQHDFLNVKMTEKATPSRIDYKTMVSQHSYVQIKNASGQWEEISMESLLASYTTQGKTYALTVEPK